MSKLKTTGVAVVAAAAAFGMGHLVAPTEGNAAPLAQDVKLSSYIPAGSNDATSALAAAAEDLQERNAGNGGKIIVDGRWTVNSTVDLGAKTKSGHRRWNMIRMEGSGIWSSLLAKETVGPMFALKSSVGLYNLSYDAMGFEVRDKASTYIWEQTAGAITNSQWEDISVEVKGAGGVLNVTGGEFHANSFRDNMYHVSKTSNYSPVRIITAGHMANGNEWDRIWAHHRDNNLKPFFEIGPPTGDYTNNAFRSITGEQNLGGLLHLRRQNGGVVDSVMEWDGKGGYINHIIKVTDSYGTTIIGCGKVVKNYSEVQKAGIKTVYLSNNQYVTTIGTGVADVPAKGKWW